MAVDAETAIEIGVAAWAMGVTRAETEVVVMAASNGSLYLSPLARPKTRTNKSTTS